MYDESEIPFIANGALAAKRRVKISAGTVTAPPQVEYAGAGEVHIGVTEFNAADGEVVTVRLASAEGTMEITASKALDEGAIVYGAANGKVSDASSGSVIGTMYEAATADGDIVNMLPYGTKSTTAATESIADAGNFTAQVTTEAALQEIYQHILTVKAFLPVPLTSLREAVNFNVLNVAGNGGVLASDTTPVLSAINGATDGCQRVLWAASNMDQVIAQVPLPADLDDAAAVVLHIRAAMAGATDTPAIAVDTFWNEGSAKVVDATGAITGAAYAEYTATIAAADVPAGAKSLTIGLTPGAHTTDTLAITAIWIEYKRKLLTS